MSLHPSLRPSKQTGVSRNVLKRHERVRHLMQRGLWEDRRSVLGLPKIKQIRLKARKAAPKEAKEASATKPATGSTSGTAPAPS